MDFFSKLSSHDKSIVVDISSFKQHFFRSISTVDQAPVYYQSHVALHERKAKAMDVLEKLIGTVSLSLLHTHPVSGVQ